MCSSLLVLGQNKWWYPPCMSVFSNPEKVKKWYTRCYFHLSQIVLANLVPSCTRALSLNLTANNIFFRNKEAYLLTKNPHYCGINNVPCHHWLFDLHSFPQQERKCYLEIVERRLKEGCAWGTLTVKFEQCLFDNLALL